MSPLKYRPWECSTVAFQNPLDPGREERRQLREELWAKFEDIYLMLTVDKGMGKGEAVVTMEATLQSFVAGRLRA